VFSIKVILDLSFSSLSGPIQSELGDLTNLSECNNAVARAGHSASSSKNKLPVSGCLSCFTCLSHSFFYAASLDFSFNSLTGIVPSELGKLLKLSKCFNYVARACRSASSSTNKLAVPVCLSFFACVSISFFCAASLNLRSNSLSGTLPISELVELSNLSECITCASRPCGSLTSSTNNFALFGCLSFCCLSIHCFCCAVSLDLGENSFIGTLPSGLGNLIELSECIDFVSRPCGSASSSMNNFAMFGRLLFCLPVVNPFLSFCAGSFDLSQNSFTGTLPSELGKMSLLSECINCVSLPSSSASSSKNKLGLFCCLSCFACLSISFFYAALLDLAGNAWSGALPNELWNLTGLSEYMSCISRPCGSASGRTSCHYSVVSHLFTYLSLSFVQRRWIYRTTHSTEPCPASLAT
jgi:hypothetical protein